MEAGSPLNVLFGICTPYRQFEPTYISCRVARWAAYRYLPFTIYTEKPPRPKVDAAFDNVLLDPTKLKFSSWLEKSTAVFWAGFPPYEQVSYVSNSLKKRTFLYVDPRTIDEDDKYTLSLVDAALVPSQRMYRLLTRRWKLRNVIYCPYSANIVPQSRIGLRSRLVRIAVPVIDEFAVETELAFIYQLNGILKQCSNVTIRLIISPSKISSSAKRRIKALVKLSQGRFEVCKVASFDNRAAQLLDVDLVVWPALRNNAGCYLNLCASLGVPFVCFGFPPNDEFASDLGGYTVDVPYNTEDKVRWTAIPDYTAFVDKIVELVQNPRELRLRSKFIQTKLANRASVFNKTMDSLFEI